ncbi:hypothetical protein [Virgibacillus sediminis]|uniref:Uncharacterized protein n=1 Tax=Virgibacillus sediminis TaxID=202260 RepID=A0ABV7A1Z7_9BACI
MAKVISKVVLAAGIVTIITGLVLAYQMAKTQAGMRPGPSETEFMINWHAFFQFFHQFFTNGMILIGLSEGIRLLQGIYEKKSSGVMPVFYGRKGAKIPGEEGESEVMNDAAWEPAEEDIIKIYELYQGEAILELLRSPVLHHCAVKLQREEGPVMKVVDVSGPEAKETDSSETESRVREWYRNLA